MRIEMIGGIGPRHAVALRAGGIASVAKLLDAGCNRQGRDAIARDTGISDTLILRWVNRADLCRIRGVSTRYSELLEAAGVDTVKELRNRRPDNLAARMRQVNAERQLVRRPPSEPLVTKWVAQAKSLEPKLSY